MDGDILRQMQAIEAHHWWFIGRRLILASILDELNLPTRAQVLEAGCGTGGNLQMLAKFGDVSAFEPHPYCLECARGSSLADVRPGRLPDQIPFTSGSFDLVAAFDVLEHVADDLGGLIALRDMLKPGGYLIFTVPAFMLLWSEHDERNHHYRRYTKMSVTKLTKMVGFCEIQCQYFNTFLFPFIAATRLIKKILHLRHMHDDILPPSALNRIFLNIFAAEQCFMRRLDFPFGTSLVMTARNPQSPADRARN
ncbi:MAG TPA: methyltransferase domain-containing protein [Stellaceae bacterium]|nr:methyltransferase domain-containing protein [Stellaceae bacterium]